MNKLPYTLPNQDDVGPVQRHVFNHKTGAYEVRPPRPKFIKGPIPLDWISKANSLPGKAGAVGVALWFLVGVQRSTTIKTTNQIEVIAACGRKAVYSALEALEKAGLIRKSSAPGNRPPVEICAKDPSLVNFD
ncbi:MAG TPA: hypothetical protein VEK34_11165 [Methylocella sp.]|nr:hypothetical protein [Methylocella sp.]